MLVQETKNSLPRDIAWGLCEKLQSTCQKEACQGVFKKSKSNPETWGRKSKDLLKIIMVAEEQQHCVVWLENYGFNTLLGRGGGEWGDQTP